jgi:hypothetical protein
MRVSTASMEWLEDVPLLEITELDVMIDLDPGWLVWDPEPLPARA